MIGERLILFFFFLDKKSDFSISHRIQLSFFKNFSLRKRRRKKRSVMNYLSYFLLKICVYVFIQHVFSCQQQQTDDTRMVIL